ncbi:MAG: putative photosynthetic complex assembly protein PuhE [Pseudomonadota bacterium]
MLASPWIAGLFALFVWWFSTGAILWAVMRTDQSAGAAHGWGLFLATPVLALGIAGLSLTLADTTVLGAYIAFVSALAIWGWVELSFLSGVITGPNREVCPPDAEPWDRFLRAWGTIAHHETLLAASLAAIAWASIGALNQIAVLTFGVLFFARVSAKLNLFFGVPKINIEFLPRPLAHLPSHFRYARLNWVFPVSVTVLAFAVFFWVGRATSAITQGDKVGFALLAALTALALLEHWLMVLPLPDEKLWRWLVATPKPNKKTLLSEDTHGL